MTDRTPHWGFLTNHAQVLICIADEPGVRLRDVSERVGITERAAHRIVAELAEATENRLKAVCNNVISEMSATVRQRIGGVASPLASPNSPPSAVNPPKEQK